MSLGEETKVESQKLKVQSQHRAAEPDAKEDFTTEALRSRRTNVEVFGKKVLIARFLAKILGGTASYF
jgi:hypothetical protein